MAHTLGLCNIIGLPVYCNILVSNTYCNTFFHIAIRIAFYPLFPLISNLFKFNIFLQKFIVINENLFLQQLSVKIYFIESKHMTCTGWLYIEIRVCERPKTQSETS